MNRPNTLGVCVALAACICTTTRAVAGPSSAPAHTSVRTLRVPVNVFAEDRRRELQEKSRPWSAIGRLVVGQKVACTAVLIAPDLVLTNAHCILEGKSSPTRIREIGQGEIVFSAGASKSGATAKTVMRRVWMGTNHEDDAANDWAILQADDRIGDKVGWLQTSAFDGEQLLNLMKRGPLHIVSYPSDLGGTEVPYLEQGCAVTRVLDAGRLLLHGCSASTGSSGAPMFVDVPGGTGRPELVALHAKEFAGVAAQPGARYDDTIANVAVPATAWRGALEAIGRGGNNDAIHAAAHISAGRKYQQQGRDDLAIVEFSEAIAITSGDPSAYHLRGISRLRRDDLQRGMADFTKAISIAPTFAPAFIDRGTLNIQTGDLGAAYADFNQAIAADPQSANGYLGRGRVHSLRREMDKAMSDLTRAVELAPRDPEFYIARGDFRRQQGQIAEAIADYSKALAIDPNSVDALVNRGIANEADDDFVRAVEDYTSAIALAPSAQLYTNRGKANYERREIDLAIADFTTALGLDPSHVPALVLRGNANQSKAALDAARADYMRAVEIDPRSPNGYHGLGKIEVKQGRLAQAIARFSKAIEIDPRSELFFQDRGVVYRMMGDVDRALADYRKSVELDATNPDTARSLGVLLFVKGDFDAAARQFATALERTDNGYTMLWHHLALARRGGGGDPAQLEARAKRLRQAEWPMPIIEAYLGKRAYAAVLPPGATDAKRCEASFYIGQRQILDGKREEAAQSLEAAVKGCPKDFIEYIGAVGELQRWSRTKR
jgi:tetratricopeptide (TPR) repeat protein/V8-like Glu-specific endopeptidase